MKVHGIVLFLLVSALIGTVSAATAAYAANSTTSSSTATSGLAGEININSIQVSPAVLMPGDTATITVSLSDIGADTLGIRSVQLLTQDFKVVNALTYNIGTTIGPGSTQSYTFTIIAGDKDGIYYPRFYLDLSNYGVGNGGSLGIPVPVKIDDTPLSVNILSSPDTFGAGQKDTVIVSVGNPRDSNITGVIVTPVGDGITTTQSSLFLGTLNASQVCNATFTITPSKETNLSFVVSYKNGLNDHNATVSLPVTFGKSKLSPSPLLNDIVVTNSGAYYTITGDATNAGINQAYNVVVHAGSPATPINPYAKYDVGTLASDDFASFQVTFTMKDPADTSVPLVVEYKDANGNLFNETEMISLNAPAGAGNRTGGYSTTSGQGGRGGLFGLGNGVSKVPFVPIIAGIILIVAALIAWRKGVFAKVRSVLSERFRKNQ